MESERCAIVVVSRDRFSTTKRCLDFIIEHTPEPHDMIVVLGGAPRRTQEELAARYGGLAQLIFEPRFLNPAESRNIGLSAVRTRLAVLMDNDVYVRPGWFRPLIRCQRETGAAMVVPVILEHDELIHTAGNDLYISYKNGEAYGRKVLRFYLMRHYESTNLKRRPTDYGELHCQLVEAETARRLKVYDENIQEVGEVDSGLVWAKARCSMWFEPGSVVKYDLPRRVTEAEDIRFFAWRWDMRKILEGYLYFRRKWNMDISDQGVFKNFLVSYNSKLGLLPRLLPCRFTLSLDHLLREMGKMLLIPSKVTRRMRAQIWGYGDWTKELG